ncbi:Six-hairpin glycosidase [Fistulina hepatica ATCC 64428]|uniref:Six-hairpin glycosidase n=1 Tax=Fistulina hepatica ATCC 64428 TaxID=1128425 RepID=A0A0D7ANJ1_9AGAR|nr:Six-hairpin glycosidase [Fistulina hepatica ATCC 64428]
MRFSLLSLSVFGAVVVARAPAGPWDDFNYAPSTRLVSPATLHAISGATLVPTQGVTNSTAYQFSGNASYIVFDFGKEVGGLTSVDITEATDNSSFSLAYTESPLFISPFNSDDSRTPTSAMDSDGVEDVSASGANGTTWTQEWSRMRGGFRYLTIASTNDAPLSLANIVVNITFMPHWDEPLDAYTGYFYAKDTNFSAEDYGYGEDQDFLTKAWYAGAYTVQTNIIPWNAARQHGWPVQGWALNATGSVVEGPILTDGAKRDRWVWPGDMGIALHTVLVSTNDLVAARNSLITLFAMQDATTGALPYVGPPDVEYDSVTYICWSLIGMHDYWLYTGDVDTLTDVWQNYTRTLAFLGTLIDTQTGLLDVPDSFANDWGREAAGGQNSAANAIWYYALLKGYELATVVGDGDLAAECAYNASVVKAAFNSLLWDESAGMYCDNATTTMHPQDGNALAVLFNLTETTEQSKNVSKGLTQFWTDIGPLCPELPDTVIPFIGGFEVKAHFVAGEGERALDLLHSEWGYMLYSNITTRSTFMEGYTADGSLGYRGNYGYDQDSSYTSLSHGWSTGVTAALTNYVLGLQLTAPAGTTFDVRPVLSGLTEAQGGFETALGWFGVHWAVSSDLDDSVWTLNVTSPANTTGTVYLPAGTDASAGVYLDGELYDARVSGQVTTGSGNHTVVVGLNTMSSQSSIRQSRSIWHSELILIITPLHETLKFWFGSSTFQTFIIFSLEHCADLHLTSLLCIYCGLSQRVHRTPLTVNDTRFCRRR